jgi:hypothetical protein
MKIKKCILTLALVGAASTAHAQLLVDAELNGNGGGNPTLANFEAIFPTLTLTDSAIGRIRADNSVGLITNLTASVTGTPAGSNAATFGPISGGNNILNDYFADRNFITGVADPDPVSVSLGGFADASGVAQTMVGINGSFTLLADQAYTLYLIGAGDSDGQNGSFTFGGETKTTTATIIGTNPDAGHTIAFSLTTPTDLAGFTIDFTVTPDASNFGAFNGLALVAIPEPSSFALLSGLLVLGLVATKRRRSVK